MIARSLLLSVSLLGVACTAEIEVQTTPVDLAIPVTSVGVDGFAELAIRMPEEARGVITVISVEGTAMAVNATTGATMEFQLYVLPQGVEGTAQPDSAPFLFTEATAPAYFAQALPLVAATSFGPNSQTPQTIANPGLVPAVAQEVIWLVASNTVTNVGFGTAFPLELQLRDLSFNVVVTKSFETSAGGIELIGL